MPWQRAVRGRAAITSLPKAILKAPNFRSLTACVRFPSLSLPTSAAAAGTKRLTRRRAIPEDHWDERRNARMRKPQPGGALTLCVESLGWAGGEFAAEQAVDGLRVRYSLESSDGLAILDDLQWADWSADGLLLAATRSGHLQIRGLNAKAQLVFDQDLAALEPNPQPAPDHARHW